MQLPLNYGGEIIMRSKNNLKQIPARPFRDMDLSLAAAGMIGRMYALSDENGMTGYDLCATCRLDMEDIFEITGELCRAGYLAKKGGLFILKESENVNEQEQEA